jgi:hypothetical protein
VPAAPILLCVLADNQYDYPSDLAENLTEAGAAAQAAWTSFANKNLKNTRLAPTPGSEKPKGPHQPKTMAHAFSRAAKEGAVALGNDDRLGISLGVYGDAMEKVSGRCGLGRRECTHVVQRAVRRVPWR